MEEEKNKVIKKLISELLDLLEIKAEIKIEKDKNGVYHLNLKTKEGGILIGSHGRTLQALKSFLSLALFKKFSSWIPILVDVNNYWEKREKELRDLAKSLAQKVATNGKPVSLPFLTPAERRIVHLALSSHPKVFSESEGEGRERKLVIKPKPEN